MSEGRSAATGSQSRKRLRGNSGRRAAGYRIWLLGLLCLTSVLLALGGDAARLALRYERGGVLTGEYWRLITGHFVHATPAHLFLNLTGLGLMAALFPREYSVREWLIVLAVSLLCIDAGFVLFEPQLQWYVGLSGVLHGALAAGAVGWWKHESKPLALALSSVLIGKLGWEQWQGALPLSGDMPVIVDAHLYGAVGGLLAGAGIALYLQRWSADA